LHCHARTFIEIYYYEKRELIFISYIYLFYNYCLLQLKQIWLYDTYTWHWFYK